MKSVFIEIIRRLYNFKNLSYLLHGIEIICLSFLIYRSYTNYFTTLKNREEIITNREKFIEVQNVLLNRDVIKVNVIEKQTNNNEFRKRHGYSSKSIR